MNDIFSISLIMIITYLIGVLLSMICISAINAYADNYNIDYECDPEYCLFSWMIILFVIIIFVIILPFKFIYKQCYIIFYKLFNKRKNYVGKS